MNKFLKLIALIMIILSCSYGKFLKPNEAFKVDISANENDVLIKVDLGKGIYIYDEKFHISITTPIDKNLDKDYTRPKTDIFHKTNVFNKNFDIKIPFENIKKYIKNEKFTLEVSWQGCSTAGLCYQPMKKQKLLSFDGKKKNISEQDAIANSLKSKSLFWILASFFGFGLLLALTPCVFPMIPILSSIIVSSSGENMNAKRGFLLSLVYVLAMSLAYAIAGVLAGVFGSNIQAALQNPYVLFSFSAIFVLLALSMFGFYDIQLPRKWQSAANKKSDSMKGKGILGVAVMGFLSALIVGPCVAAPLAGALIYIGQSGDAVLGGIALFVMSIGMGFPLLIIGASAGKFLPKPGMWMDRIKSIFGVLMLGVAIWMIQRVVSTEISLLLWAMLFISSAFYMGVFESTQSKWGKLLKSFAFIMLLYGVILFVGIFIGGGSVFSPLKGLHSQQANTTIKSARFTNVANLNELKKQINTSKKPIMIDFSASWCISCKEMDEETFEDKKVANVMNDFTLIRIDVTKNTQEDEKMLKKFGLFGPPGIIFFKNKKELKDLRVVGFKKPDEFLKVLENVKSR